MVVLKLIKFIQGPDTTGSGMNIRIKVILSMLLLISFISAAFLFLLYQQNQRGLAQLIEGRRQAAQLLADSVLSQTRANYQRRIKSFVDPRVSPNREDLLRAFAKRDRERLLRLSWPFFEVLRRENSYFATLGWILPDNQAFVRVHDPERELGDVSEQRPDIEAVNRDRVQHSGFTSGASGPQLRVVQPVVYQGRYLGVVQMGIDARLVLDTLKDLLPEISGFAVADKWLISSSNREMQGLAVGGYHLYSSATDFIKQISPGIDWSRSGQRVEFDGKLYSLHNVLPLKDFQDQVVGNLFVAIDITEVIAQSNKTIITAIILSLILFLLSALLLYFSFGSLIQNIVDLNRSLEQANQILEQRVEARTRELLTQVEERKVVEDKLHRAEKMEAIGLMASGVAHDLNNILSGIVSYPELLLMRLPEDSSLRQPLNVIRESGTRAAAVVADLLTLARDAAKVRIMADLNSLILEYLQSPEAALLHKSHPRVHITTDLEPDLPQLCCSPTHVSKSIMNLVTNAVEAFDEVEHEGRILIRSRKIELSGGEAEALQFRPGGYLVLEFEDNGRGMSADDQKHIFEPFYTKKKMGRSGTGIGLAVVWNCMQDHQGQVRVHSIEDQGTFFSLYFPLDNGGNCHKGSETQQPTQIRGTGQTILVVDDEPRQRDIAVQILTELGYRMTAAASGEEAIELVKKESFDLLLLDMIMDPGLDGCETFAEIITFRPGQKAIIVSGYSDSEQIDQALALGVSDFLVKPYSVVGLGSVVAAVLAA